MKPVKNLSESKLFHRLEHAETDDATARKELAANVAVIVEEAITISRQINQVLPQFTLHNDKHLLNVLSIMEELLPEATLRQLTPLECALCILAAFTHDLGLALSAQEKKRLYGSDPGSEDHKRFLRHRDEFFGEELRQIDRLRKEASSDSLDRAGIIEGHILADFVRRTHAATPDRVRNWFDYVEKSKRNERLFCYGNLSFKDYLVQIAISHNQDTNWLRRELTRGRKDEEFLIHAGTESVNLAFPGLLLRLADYMDFDASRAPRILFHHFGIEDEISVKEWGKHMAMTGWRLRPEVLLYEAHDCRLPILDKTIRDFVRDIDLEIRKVRDELNDQRRKLGEDGARYGLNLPEKAEARVRPAKENGRDCYIFSDLQFRLDQDEIQQLLMGESLYGDPSLAIRELLQNALDALQMRDLRLKFLHEHPDQKSELEPTDLLGIKEELAVHVTWGTDEKTGQEFIRVTDNGTGMTRVTLEKFFTQLGKSYYRSPDFAREQALLRRNQMFAAPISHFGIGIFSCFMIGDRLEVRTCPGGQNDQDRAAFDLTVSGPGSLFWLRSGTLLQQGTEVTVFLKKRFRLHQEADWRRILREHFYRHSGIDEDEVHPELLDPFLAAAIHVIWPTYPILFKAEDSGSVLRLDDELHSKEIFSPEVSKFAAEGANWNCSPERLGDLHWELFDWTDEEGQDATGSRIRFIFPRHFHAQAGANPLIIPQDGALCSVDQIAFLVERTLDIDKRTLYLVKGMAVSNDQAIESLTEVEAGVGTLLWIDLRGTASPLLTADRQTALRRAVDTDEWENIVRGVFMRWGARVRSIIEACPASLPHWLHQLRWSPSTRPGRQTHEKPSKRIVLSQISLPGWIEPERLSGSTWKWRVNQWIQETRFDYDCSRVLRRDSNLPNVHYGDDSGSLYRFLALAWAIDLANDLALAVSSDSASSTGDTFVRARALGINPDHEDVKFSQLANALDTVYSHDNRGRVHYNRERDGKLEDLLRSPQGSAYSALRICLDGRLLSEGFYPSLELSFPLLWVGNLEGQIGDGYLDAPGIVSFDLKSDDRAIRTGDPDGKRPGEIVDRGYDLVFPFSGIPLGNLRQKCEGWRRDRGLAAMGILPFLWHGNDGLWRKHARAFHKILGIREIYVLFPEFELWNKKFIEWTDDDWEKCGLSAHWDVETGVVLWARGGHHKQAMRVIGRPIDEFIRTLEEESNKKNGENAGR